MAHKLVWGLPPEIMVSKSGKRQAVGVKHFHDTGKKYPPGPGAKQRAKAAAKETKKNG